MQKNDPVHTMCIRDVEGKIYAFLTSELSDFSTLRKNPWYRVDSKLVVTLCQAEEVGNNKNAFLHHELNPSCSALITHSLTQQFQLVCVQTSAKRELRSHQRKAVTIHQLAGPVMKCNFCDHKFLTFFKMVVIK